MRIAKTLEIEAVPWRSMRETLAVRQLLGGEAVDRALSDFFRRVRSPFHLGWFARRRLSGLDNLLAAVMCESCGADSVSIHFAKTLRVGPLRLHYEQDLQFRPTLTKSTAGATGLVVPREMVIILGHAVPVTTLARAILVHAVLALILLVSTIVTLGLFTYGFAVCVAFFILPYETIVHATTTFHVGLALVVFLMLCASGLGHLLRSFRRSGERPRRGSQAPIVVS